MMLFLKDVFITLPNISGGVFFAKINKSVSCIIKADSFIFHDDIVPFWSVLNLWFSDVFSGMKRENGKKKDKVVFTHKFFV